MITTADLVEDSTLPPSSPEKSTSTGQESTSTTSKDLKGIKGRQNKLAFPDDAFVSVHADIGKYQGRFKILPYSRASNPKYCGVSDKLVQCIKKGGGLVIECKEGQLSPQGSQNVIQILDVEYVRANIKETQDMILPYDCFSSSFIWNQVYQRSSSNSETRNADLNLYRISPSAHVTHDANGIFQGTVTWNDIEPISSEKLSPAIKIKKVALQLYPELIVLPSSLRPRRIYTRHESQMLLDKICEVDGHDGVLGIRLYKDIAEAHFLDRSSTSLKEHFRKTILPHVLTNDGYYTVASKDFVKFQMAMDKEGREKLRRTQRMKRTREEDEDVSEEI